MSDADTAVDVFESERPHLLAVAYRMLGSMTDAEDAVQDTFLRWRSAGDGEVRVPRAYLTTTVTRICLDVLKSARVRREQYDGPWLPEPVRTEEGGVDPESISMAFLVLLESLTPLERATYLLHEVFDYTHEEISAIVGTKVETCRQSLHRAKQRIADGRPRFRATRAAHERIMMTFAEACMSGDLAGTRAILAEDVVTWSDGGGKVPAARRPVVGAEHVARFFLGLAKRAAPGTAHEVRTLNGEPAFVTLVNGVAAAAILIQTDGTLIHAVHVVRNPDKLERV